MMMKTFFWGGFVEKFRRVTRQTKTSLSAENYNRKQPKDVGAKGSFVERSYCSVLYSKEEINTQRDALENGNEMKGKTG